MSGEKYRIQEVNSLRIKIKEYETSIARMEKSNDDITRSNVNYDKKFIDNFRDKNKKKIEEYKKLIEETEGKIRMINSGRLDEEMKEERKKNAEVFQKAKEKIKDKKEENKKKEIKKEIMFKKEKSDNKQDRDAIYHINRGESYFYNVVDSFPDYMREKLKNMPHNKGYIWRDVWFLGDLPDDGKGDLVLFEKKGRDILLIHEYKRNMHTIYEKYQTMQKRMIRQTILPRKPDIEKLYKSLGIHYPR